MAGSGGDKDSEFRKIRKSQLSGKITAAGSVRSARPDGFQRNGSCLFVTNDGVPETQRNGDALFGLRGGEIGGFGANKAAEFRSHWENCPEWRNSVASFRKDVRRGAGAGRTNFR